MSLKTLLVFGGDGQLGRALAEATSPQNGGWRVTTVSRAAADIADADQVARAIDAHEPAMVVNAAAYTAVDKAESESEAAYRANRDGAGIVAHAAAEALVPVLHLSTDYVFDGEASRPWREDDPIRPLGVYGASKAAGEEAVRDAARRHVILRTSWVFGVHGTNFVKTMLRLGAERPALKIVADQVGRPTSAHDLAGAILAIAARQSAGVSSGALYGTFHFANEGAVSWCEFAREIFAQSARRGGPAPAIEAIATSGYPTPAKRPAYSVLDCDKLRRLYGIQPRPWQAALADVLARLLPDKGSLA
ncbi:MAG: dTDP-4-dehydrorhamnose reductase [Alphaproteobacteria bacterium]